MSPVSRKQSSTNPDFLSTVQAFGHVGVSRAQFFRLKRTDPTFPKPLRYGPRCLRWRRRELDAWMVKRQVAA